MPALSVLGGFNKRVPLRASDNLEGKARQENPNNSHEQHRHPKPDAFSLVDHSCFAARRWSPSLAVKTSPADAIFAPNPGFAAPPPPALNRQSLGSTRRGLNRAVVDPVKRVLTNDCRWTPLLDDLYGTIGGHPRRWRKDIKGAPSDTLHIAGDREAPLLQTSRIARR